MVGDDEQDAPPSAHHALHVMGKHLTEMRPTEIEHAPQIAERHEDASRRVRRDGDVDAAIHALQDSDSGRMLRKIAFTCQPSFRAAEILSVSFGKIEQPVDALLNRTVMDAHDAVFPSTFSTRYSTIFYGWQNSTATSHGCITVLLLTPVKNGGIT